MTLAIWIIGTIVTLPCLLYAVSTFWASWLFEREQTRRAEAERVRAARASFRIVPRD